jgi:hypothetical protein
MPLEGVVRALHNIHAALAPGAILVDTQPVSARPQVATDGVTLGALDMREWLDTIQAVDEAVAETIRIGLYELRHESRFVVTDTFDDGPECLEIVDSWRGTRVPDSVSTRLAATTSQVTVQQEIRLRLLRSEPQQLGQRRVGRSCRGSGTRRIFGTERVDEQQLLTGFSVVGGDPKAVRAGRARRGGREGCARR